MKKISIILVAILIFIITFSILFNPEAFFSNIISTLNLWLYKVYPSIFTFYAVSSLLLNTNILNKLTYYFRFIFKRFKFTNQNNLNLFILSIFIGNPSTSGLIIQEIKNNNISIDNGNNLLKYSSFQNPLFIISFLFPISIKYALYIIFVHILSNIIIVFFQNRKNKYTIIKNSRLKFSIKEILESINNIIYILLIISSMMVLANIIIFSITTIINFLNLNNFYISLLLTQFEITQGMNYLLNLKINNLIILILVCFTVAFNGLSIHLQVFNIISKYNLKYKNFFLYRIIQGLLSIILFIILIIIEKSLF